MDDYMFTLEAGRLPVPGPWGAASSEGLLSKMWHKSGFGGRSDAQRGKLRDGLERKMGPGGVGTKRKKKLAMLKFWDVYLNPLKPPHSPLCFSTWAKGPVSSIWPRDCRPRVELRFLVGNSFRKQQCVYFGAGINSSEVQQRWISPASLILVPPPSGKKTIFLKFRRKAQLGFVDSSIERLWSAQGAKYLGSNIVQVLILISC